MIDTQILMTIWLGEVFILASLILVASILFMSESLRHRELKSVARYSLAISIFFFIIALNGFLDYAQQYTYFVLEQATLFPAEMQVLPGGTTSFYIIISLLHLSYAILSFQIEKYVINRSVPIFTITLLVCFGISLLAFFGPLFPLNIQTLLVYIINFTLLPFGLIIFYWGIFYLVFAKRGIGIVRQKALMVALGLGAIMIGIMADTGYREAMLTSGHVILWGIPILFKTAAIIGVPLLFFGLHRKSEK